MAYYSSAYRRLAQSGEQILERDIINYEKSLLSHAVHKGFGFEYGRRLNDFELLAKLQHHGAATRLVDFSKNSLVALWFAIFNQDKTGLLFGVQTEYIAGSWEGSANYFSESYEELVGNLKKSDSPFFIEPPVVSPRIAAQHGVFLYSDLSKDPRGSLKLPSEKNANLFIAISPELKEEVKRIFTSRVFERCREMDIKNPLS